MNNWIPIRFASSLSIINKCFDEMFFVSQFHSLYNFERYDVLR